MDKVEVRAVIKYFCKRNFIKILVDEAPSYSTVKKWAAEFRGRGDSVEDYDGSGHPKEATTDQNIELVHSLIT